MAKNNVAKYRKIHGFTLQEVADMAGTSKSYVWELEKGNENVSLQKAYAIASALGECIVDVFPDRNKYQEDNFSFYKSVKVI